MKGTITINKKEIKYSVRYGKRALKIRLSINPKGECTVTIPKFIPKMVQKSIVESFIRKQSDWIFSKIDYFNGLPERPKGKSKKEEKEEYLKNKGLALSFVVDRVKYWNQFYNFKFNKISIKNQKSRWGSCSSKGNINFNYKILNLPKELSDYIVVHELCHLGQMNHSKKFWDLVGQTIPDYKNIKAELSKKHLSLM